MGAWKNAFFLQEKPMSIKFLLLGGGGGVRGGGSADFILWARGFSDLYKLLPAAMTHLVLPFLMFSREDTPSAHNGSLWIALSDPVRDAPPYCAIPLSDSIAEGGIAPFLPCFHVVSRKYRCLCRGVSHHVLQEGNAQKRGRGYRTQVAILGHQKPQSAQQGVSLT